VLKWVSYFVFIRKLKSSKGKVYIQVIDKSSGTYIVVRSFGGAIEGDHWMLCVMQHSSG
jgi:hypothetical protein